MPKSDQSMYDLDYLFAYLELPKIKNPLFRQKRTCNFEFEISGTCPDFHNKILKPFLNVDTIGCQKTTFESGILHFTKKPIIFFARHSQPQAHFLLKNPFFISGSKGN